MDEMNFETFDPNALSNYDPSAEGFEEFGKIAGMSGRGLVGAPKRATKPQAATFTVTIDGSGNAASHVVELFNFQRSITKLANGSTNPGLQPLLAAKNNQLRDAAGTGVSQLYAYGAILASTGAAGADGIYWAPNGNLIYNFNNATSDNITISCNEIEYRSLFDYTGIYAFRINKMRINYTQATQIGQDFTHIYKNFLGTTQNSSISPNQFFTPNQFQSLIVDVPTPFNIDFERGLQYTLLPNSKVTITFFVQSYQINRLA